MQKKLFALIAISTLTLVGCNTTPEKIEADPLNATMIADFSKGESEEFFASDGWSNGQPFNAVWKGDNITYSNEQMHLGIQEKETTADGVTYPYTAGEARSHKLYGYGDFEVRMKPTNVVGTVSTFFTYTDMWNKVDGVENKHDEIDIEFLGKDTTKVQFNYFVTGQGGHEYMYDLGFDASKDFHNYGFRWEEGAITWFVDGEPVYQVKGNKDTLPSQSGRIMTSYWPSSADNWSGHFAGATSDTVDYQWIKSSSETIYADGEKPVDPVDPEEGIKWDEVTPTPVTYDAERLYTVSTENDVATVTYEEAGGYSNVVGTGIETAANANNALNVTLKNNGPTESVIRVDVQGSVAQGNTDCLNTSAYAEGHSEVYTDKEWGGSKLTLKAGEEVEFIINYDATTERGAAKCLLFFIDSLDSEVKAHAGGNIQISKVKFASNGEVTPVIPPSPQPQGEEVELTFWTSPSITVTPYNTATKSITVTYTDVAGNTYTPFGANYAAEGKTSFSFKIKNDGAATTQLRVDVLGETIVGNTNSINTSATAEGHSEIYTDTEWGGSKLDVASGEEVVFVINFDQTTDRGAMTGINFFADTARGSADLYTGNLTLSNFIFA